MENCKNIKESEIHPHVIKVQNLSNSRIYNYNWETSEEYKKEVASGIIHQRMGGKSLSDYKIEQKYLLTNEGGNYSVSLAQKELQKVEKLIKEIKSLNLQDNMSIFSLFNQVSSCE